jgi:hypothetical protein
MPATMAAAIRSGRSARDHTRDRAKHTHTGLRSTRTRMRTRSYLRAHAHTHELIHTRTCWQPVLDQLNHLRAEIDALRQQLASLPGQVLPNVLHSAPSLSRRGRRCSGSTTSAEPPPPPPLLLTPPPPSAAKGKQRQSSPLRDWASSLENPLTPPLLQLAAWFEGGDTPSPGIAAQPHAPVAPHASASDWSWAAAPPTRGSLAAVGRRRATAFSADSGKTPSGVMRSDLVWLDQAGCPASSALSLTPMAAAALAAAAKHRDKILAARPPQAGRPRGVGARSRGSGGGRMLPQQPVSDERSPAGPTNGRSGGGG